MPRAHFADPIPCSFSFRPSCMHPVWMCSCLPAFSQRRQTTITSVTCHVEAEQQWAPKWYIWALSVITQPKHLLRWSVAWMALLDKHLPGSSSSSELHFGHLSDSRLPGISVSWWQAQSISADSSRSTKEAKHCNEVSGSQAAHNSKLGSLT